MENIKNKSIIILAHVYTTVPAEDLKEYCISQKVKRLLFIAHPLIYKKGKPGSYYEIYEENILMKKVSLKNRKLPGVIQYMRDYLLTIYWITSLDMKWDLMIALDNLNTLSGLTLRKLGFVEKIIYYTIDFVPIRFKYHLLNELYHFIDKIDVQSADVTWNLTERMAVGREKIRGMMRNMYTRQYVVPIGVWINRIPNISFSQRESHTIVYAGGLLPHQGVQIVLDAIPQIIKKIPDLQLKIIGIGSYEAALKEKVEQLHIEKNVRFLGYMEKHTDVEKILTHCSLALAMYSKELDIWSYYADPSKIKTYLATGLPVLTTDVTYIAKELVKHHCGAIIEYNKDEVAKTVITILSDKVLLKVMHKNALAFAKQFDWNIVYGNALKKI